MLSEKMVSATARACAAAAAAVDMKGEAAHVRGRVCAPLPVTPYPLERCFRHTMVIPRRGGLSKDFRRRPKDLGWSSDDCRW